MFQNGFKKIKINLEYGTTIVNLEVEPYRPIKYLKQRASQIFYPLNFEVRVSYCNKDLTPFEEVNVGEYFKGKSNIAVKVFQIVPETKERKLGNILLPSIKSNTQLMKSEFICDCKKGLINSYCRECNEFHCKDCRANVYIF
jgi:hypothetical protein